MALILPGYDPTNGNANSVLFKTYKNMCSTYTLGKPLEDQTDILINGDFNIAVVHSYGFFVFLIGYQIGLFKNVTSLVVIDGYFPKDRKFNETEYEIKLPPIPILFFFPTFGNRQDYPLEAIVRQAMISRKNITVVRGHGFGHNLIFEKFDTDKVADLVLNLQHVPETRTSDLDLNVYFPETDISIKRNI